MAELAASNGLSVALAASFSTATRKSTCPDGPNSHTAQTLGGLKYSPSHRPGCAWHKEGGSINVIRTTRSYARANPRVAEHLDLTHDSDRLSHGRRSWRTRSTSPCSSRVWTSGTRGVSKTLMCPRT